MVSSFGRLGMATDTPLSAYKPLHEYQILRVSNSPHLYELCITLLVVVQSIPLCTVSSFTKRPACLEHCQVWLPTSSRSSNSTIPAFVRYAFFLACLSSWCLSQRHSSSYWSTPAYRLTIDMNPLSFYLMEQLLKSKDCHLDMYRPVRAVISSPAGDFFSLRGEKKRFPAWGVGTTRPVCPVRTAQYRVLYHTELSWY
ncbi:hypothetical protein BHE74_00038742 [Ensete ventricosum]|nr:hypothetical protein BHE74_00038742 [Ensete ventricosum]RZS09234.1 hypothetical protein BHM03_00040291 [Ensete ventricosum]